MRTLNRPMFRYGGPIKEGVMHGIREPKRNGGSMRAALVGNPMFPVGPDGRAQHNKALQYIGSKVPFLANTYNRGLANLKKIPGFFSSKMNKTVPKVMRDSRGRVIGEGGEAVPTYLGRDPLVKLVGGTYRLATDPRAKGVGKKVVDATTSPTGLLTIGSFTDVLPGGNPLFGQRNVLGQKFDKETGIKTEGLFGRDLPAKAELEKIETDRIAKAEADEQARLKALYEVQNPEIREPKKSEEEIRKERIQKYRDIMDIKGMNKNAAYDSLIAASQAVLGADDLKGSLKDGSLINKIIGSTSKAFDKPSKTKDAIDTLILKGEIEKDISLAKGNSSTQQLAALAAASGKSTKFIANAKLDIPNTPGQAKSQLVKLKKGTVTSDDVTAVIVSYGEDNGIPFKKQITTEQKNEQVGKGKKFASVTELIDSLSLDPNGADDGLYVVGTSVVEVDKGIPKLRG
jgi:hypothetical protein